MVLPDVCPLDGRSHCKKHDCHLYHVEWRTGEEQCIIGYRATHKTPSKDSTAVQDNYAENTRIRLGRDFTKEPQTRYSTRLRVEDVIKENTIEPTTVYNEKTVVDERDTTVIQSNNTIRIQGKSVVSEVNNGKKNKTKTIDDAMKLDLPDNYEEKFWS
ncbi:MAG: hypothetical protein MIO92_01105 [Methanosarcinaceae archaeon]|nr:hypothetical protein [Methanosarcinaceae archaeon]